MENKLVTVTGGAAFVYDGDGNRGKKTEGGQTVLYVNKYYEKNLTTAEVTSHYYLGSKQIAIRKGTSLTYIQQDHLGGTTVVSDNTGAPVGTIKYFSFGDTRSSSGTLPDEKFTGQRLDATGLYYYGARYYDATIGRFISADTIVPSIRNPQSLNRYSYVYNNPLRYKDSQGNTPIIPAIIAAIEALGGWEGIALIGAAAWALMVSINHGKDGKGFQAKPGDLGLGSRPPPNWDKAAFNAFLVGSGIMAVIVAIASISGKLPNQLSPKLPSEKEKSLEKQKSNVSVASPGFTANVEQLEELSKHFSVESKEYQAGVDYAFHEVYDNLGEDQIVAWSSEEGYHAVDESSIEPDDPFL